MSERFVNLKNTPHLKLLTNGTVLRSPKRFMPIASFNWIEDAEFVCERYNKCHELELENADLKAKLDEFERQIKDGELVPANVCEDYIDSKSNWVMTIQQYAEQQLAASRQKEDGEFVPVEAGICCRTDSAVPALKRGTSSCPARMGDITYNACATCENSSGCIDEPEAAQSYVRADFDSHIIVCEKYKPSAAERQKEGGGNE